MIARIGPVTEVQQTGSTSANVYRSRLIPSINTNALSVQVLGPFRQEDCFPALGTVIEQPGLNDLTGTRGPELHGGVLPHHAPPSHYAGWYRNCR